MARNGKRLPWRCKNQQQAKDKAEIYNSREWKQLRAAKLRAQPLCERCRQMGIEAGVLPNGWVRSAHCVHHITPIETAATKEEMWRLAIGCGLNGLMSLCDQCHADIHKEQGSHKAETHQTRAKQEADRWLDSIKGKTPTDADGPTT